MSQDPTLIIQIQRMGDLIISFSLIEKLLLIEPERPVWVVAEPCFYEPLISLAPKAVFFSMEMSSQLKTRKYKRVINLSHREEAAALAGSIGAEEYFGLRRKGSSLHIGGEWRLYRSSIVENNRHNQFHWSDLESLGVVSEGVLKQSFPPSPRAIGSSGNIGFFVGASEATKRPDAKFWGLLAKFLMRRGLSPIFLGGPDDVAFASEAIAFARLGKSSNLAGRFSLLELAAFLQTLDALVTPDTGPMHLANLTRTSIIDLSMGNVNPWETAALSQGHTVIAPSMSCFGCWRCDGRDFVCRQAFTPGKVGRLIIDVHGKKTLASDAYLGLTIYKTDRDDRGLFFLNPLSGGRSSQRLLFGLFWKEWFVSLLGGSEDRSSAATEEFFQQFHKIGLKVKQEILRLHKIVSNAAVKEASMERGQSFWRHALPAVRPFTGYLDLVLQNGEYKKQAWDRALQISCSLVEKIR